MSKKITVAELLARQQVATLSNFYSGFTNGPYTVKLSFRGTPPHRHTHCVFDGSGGAVITGTMQECERFKEQFNLSYAKHIMLKESEP